MDRIKLEHRIARRLGGHHFDTYLHAHVEAKAIVKTITDEMQNKPSE